MLKLLGCVMLYIGCGMANATFDDPYYKSRGAWQQSYNDQWALQRVRLPRDLPPGKPVVVAVIDTGLDFFHPDLTRDKVWVNAADPVNGKDDDLNGFIDDYYGWDFVNGDNIPWDDSGHGTHTAGIIAANRDNGIGIAGVNPNAKIMVLKAMNFTGHGRTSRIVKAIFYAVAQGAKVISLSLGGVGRNPFEDQAIAYAAQRGVVVVVAAGNEQMPVQDAALAGLQDAITVGASGLEDERLAFSNYGGGLDLVAPGLNVLSLRARRTDFALVTEVAGYKPGSNYVGTQAAYYRATGTSFAAPLVAGAASLLLSQYPELTAKQVKRMLLQSARDTATAGIDEVTGYGVLDISAALISDPSYYLTAEIAGVTAAKHNNQPAVAVRGSAMANKFKKATLYAGQGASPKRWQKVCDNISKAIVDGVICNVPAKSLNKASLWTLRLVVRHQNSNQREQRYQLTLN